MHRNFRQLAKRYGIVPRLGAVREIAVGKNDHGHHVLDRDAAGFERDPEAVARRRGRENRNRRLGISAEQRLQQIRLLGFRREAGGRAAALNVADHERQLDRDREAERFGLQRHARAGSRGDAERAGVGRADRRSDGGDFVLGLKRDDAEILVGGKLVQNVRSGRDRIRAEKERKPRLLRRGDETHRERRVSADIAIQARRELRGRNLVADLKRLGGFAVAVARLHRQCDWPARAPACS